MILHTPYLLVVSCIGCVLDGGGGGDATEAFGQLGDGVAMGHPHLTVRSKVFQQRVVLFHPLEVGTSVFASAFGFHLATKSVCHQLGTIADAKDGILATNLREIELEGTFFIDTVRRARQDDAYHIGVILRKLVVWHDFAKRVQLAHTATDELGGLRTKIQNDDFLHI